MGPARADRPCLLLIDLQTAFDEIEAAGGRRNNPRALGNIVRLLAAARASGALIIHIRHASTRPNSPFRPERPGFAPIPATREIEGEAVIVKRVNSAFIGTDLEARLRAAGFPPLVIVGATANQCVETTTRMAGNLGFDAILVADAIWAYDRADVSGAVIPAETIHRVTLANMSGEFATVMTTDAVLPLLKAGAAAA